MYTQPVLPHFCLLLLEKLQFWSFQKVLFRFGLLYEPFNILISVTFNDFDPKRWVLAHVPLLTICSCGTLFERGDLRENPNLYLTHCTPNLCLSLFYFGQLWRSAILYLFCCVTLVKRICGIFAVVSEQ